MRKKDEMDGDVLERLIKMAGPREPIDKQLSERVNRKVHAHWRSLTEQRRFNRRRRILFVAGGFAVAASIVAAILLVPPLLSPPPAVAFVTGVVGRVGAGNDETPRPPLVRGTELIAGTVVETGLGSGAALNLGSGHKLRIDELSQVQIDKETILIGRGAVYVDSGPGNTGNSIVVLSEFATIRELGTQYIVRLADDSLEVSVREGSVSLDIGTQREMALTGEAVRLEANGDISREDVAGYGDRWQWAADLGEPFELNGRTLAEFLNWVTRENGWSLVYERPSQSLDANTIKVDAGSIAGLNGVEALDSVITSVQWHYFLVDGVVTVGSGTD